MDQPERPEVPNERFPPKEYKVEDLELEFDFDDEGHLLSLEELIEFVTDSGYTSFGEIKLRPGEHTGWSDYIPPPCLTVEAHIPVENYKEKVAAHRKVWSEYLFKKAMFEAYEKSLTKQAIEAQEKARLKELLKY